MPGDRVAALENLGTAPAGDRACPRCHAVMRRGPVEGAAGTIEIDACPPCKLAWFDRGELRSLQAAVDDSPALLSQLSPEERRAWRIRKLREDASVDD